MPPTTEASGSSLQATLFAFGAVLLAPVLIVAAVVLWQVTSAEQARTERDARAGALRMMAAIDRELATVQASAQTLASSAALHAGNYARFHERAREIIRTWNDPEDFAVVVRDTTGQQVVNTRLPWGAPLPRGVAFDLDQEVIERKGPVFQGIFVGATAGRPLIGVRVPVQSGDYVTHVLSVSIEPRRFARMLEPQGPPVARTITLVDRAGRIVARSAQHDRFVGQEAPAGLRAALASDEGVWRGTDADGAAVLAGFARSQLTGWSAVVTIPVSVLRKPLWRSLLIFLTVGAVLLMTSFAVAVWFGKRIASPIRALAEAASALGRGEPVRPLTSGLREIDRVADAMVSASASLREAEERQMLLMHELNHRVKNTLATVQSLAWQSLRRDLPLEVARERFEARLLALSGTHNLLNESNWDGASLVDVLNLELDPYRGEGTERFALCGSDLKLPARTAVALGMVVHELATNAAKHGSLSHPDGRVTVSWEARDGALRLDWEERDGPEAAEPARLGFGSRLIRRTVERELAGRVEIRFGATGLRCTIELPPGDAGLGPDRTAGEAAGLERVRPAA